MKYIVAAGVVALATLCKADDVDMDRDDCSKSMSRTITMEPINPKESYSGSPIVMKVSGVASTSNFAVDVDDVKLQVKVDARIGEAFGDSELGIAEFELDLCTDVVGVKCPMLDGTPFDGVASWNSVQIPDNQGFVGNLITLTVKERAAPACSEAREVEQHAGLFFSSTEAYSKVPAISKKRTVLLNRRHDASWTAEESPRFKGMTMLDARRIAGGTVMRGQLGFEELPRRSYRAAQGGADTGAAARRSIRASKRRLASEGGLHRFSGVTSDIPDSFDAREAFPECAPVIGRVRDQSDCGSCWAFASTEAFNDRRCIAGIGKDGGSAAARADQLLVLSAEDTTACCHGIFCGLSMGCNGGQPGSAWKWFARKGVVTGGDYADVGQGTTCKPYEFQPCAHHVDPGASGYPACPDGEYPTPECRTECSEDTFGAGYEADKKLAKEAYSLRGIEDIQLDMLQFGSVTAAFSVYSDFLTYSGGVYNHVHGSYLGGHAVKIIGWGTDADSGKDYWLVVNSWNPSWGEDGMFRILRGVNECGIEGQIVAGEA